MEAVFGYQQAGVSNSQLSNLQNLTFKVAYYAEITSNSGQISIPTGATILLDQWANGVDAVLSAIPGGTGTAPDYLDTGIDVSSFDISGNYVLSGTLPGNPSALIYYLSIRLVDFGNLDIGNIIEYAEIKGSPPANVVLVAESGTDYNNPKTAYDYVKTQSPSSANRWAVLVYPGVYTIDPVELVAYVDIVSISERFTTKLIAGNINTALFTATGLGPMAVHGFSIEGVTNNAAFLNNLATTALSVAGCTIADCRYGFHVTNGVIVADNIGTTPSSVMTYMFYMTGGKIDVHTCSVRSTATFTAFFYASAGFGNLGDVFLDSANIITGVHLINDAHIDGHNLLVHGPPTAVTLEDTAVLDISNFHCGGTTAIHLEVVDLGVLVRCVSGQLDSDKFVFVNGFVNDNLQFIDVKENDEGLKVFGEFGVGRPEKGSEAVFGEGDSYTRNMLVYTRTPALTFTNESTAARSASGSTFAMPGTAINNAIYLCSDLQDASDYLFFHGIKASISTAAVLGATGEIVAEYYNGAWTEFMHMSVQSSGSYLPYANQIFERAQSEQIRFNYEILNDWVKNDEPATGTNRYWIRFRVSVAITTAPVFEQFKLHSSRSELNADGFSETFGKGRPLGTLPWSVDSLQAWSSSPTNQDLYALNSASGVDYDLGVGRIENEFNNGVTDKISFGGPLPFDIDTSNYILVELYWAANVATAGNILWKISKGIIRIGDGMGYDVGTAPTTILGEYSVDTIEAQPINEEYILKRSTFKIPIPEAIARYSDLHSDSVCFAINRDGSDALDTYGGDIAIWNARAVYVRWSDGGHQ